MADAPPLSKAAGYGVILGLGILFAVVMMFITWALRRYQNEVQTSEMFNTAGRTVKTGLVSSAVVSSWTWAATLMQSTAICYDYGVSGPFWYASGATVQILLFATLAIELKRRAPNAHTFLEVVRARYGGVTHMVFMVFGLMTNILVTAMLLAGGSAVANALTGVPVAAACFLLPVGVVVYTAFGGIKATFITDYIHTLIILIILFIFAFTAFSTDAQLGSPGKVYDLLVKASKAHPVEGNQDGSYLTMRSREGAVFFIINLVGNFGTVYLDQGYWAKAISASPAHALPGYIAGGLSWFAIPWLCATTMGLSALALEGSPVWPTYPDRLTKEQVSAGLVLPNAAVALLGKGGAGASLLLVFMAVTSASSAELIAVSSIVTYDVYQTYINPKATGSRLIKVGHMACVGYAIILAAFSTGLYYAGVGMGYLYLLMGVIISSAVLPATLTLLWDKQNWVAAAFSPILGLCTSLIAWLVTTKKLYGTFTVTTTGSNYPMLAGNVAALLSPIVYVPILTYAFGPQNYDWLSMAAIRKADDSDVAVAAHVDIELIPGETNDETIAAIEEQKSLKRAAKIARSLTAFMALSLIILWPMPMYGSGYIFSKKFFTGWVSVAILWLFCSSFVVGIYPMWESRTTFAQTVRSMIRDATGRGGIKKAGRKNNVTEDVMEGREETPEKAAVDTPPVKGDVTPAVSDEERKVET